MSTIQRSLLTASVSLILVTAGLGISSRAETTSSRQDLGLPNEVMARIKPGPQHADLAWHLGDWNVTIKMTMPGMPEMPPDKAKCRFEWLIDGRWMISRMKGAMMGMSAEWVHVHGYNNMTMNYEVIGFDSMSTDAKFSYGNPVTQDGKTLGFHGQMNEFMNGQIRKPFRTVQQRRGEDRFDIQIWDPEIGPNGAQVILMEYERAKE